MKNISLLALIFLSGTVCADPVKWLDEQGKVHYGDQAPKNIHKVEKLHFIDTVGTPPADNLYGRKSTQEMEEDFQRGKAARDKEANKEQQDLAKAQLKKANCVVAQNNLQQMEQSRRMFTTDASGERVYMNDEQRQQRLDAGQKAVKESCN